MVTLKLLGRTNLRPEQITRLRACAHLEVYEDNVPNHNVDEVIVRAQGADVLGINVFTPITAQVLDACTSVRGIVSCSSGIDHVERAACASRGVEVIWYPSYCARTLAEKAFAFILMAMNRIPDALMNVYAGHWDYLSFQGRELAGRNLCVLGYGASGKLVGRYAEAFGMTVYAVSSRSSAALVESALRAADVVSIHMSLNKTTTGFFNAATFALLKNDAVLINTARGQLIEEEALQQFLRQNPRAYAILDVLTTEPPERAYLEQRPPNLILTPHIGWNSVESDGYLARGFERDLLGQVEKAQRARVVG